MNDSRFRGPSQPSARAPSRDPRGDYGEPVFEEQPARSSRSRRDPGSDDDWRPGLGPNGGPPPGRRPSRPPDEGPEFERRPPRGSRPPEMNSGAPPSRAPRDTEMEQPGWGTRRGESRDNRA